MVALKALFLPLGLLLLLSYHATAALHFRQSVLANKPGHSSMLSVNGRLSPQGVTVHFVAPVDDEPGDSSMAISDMTFSTNEFTSGCDLLHQAIKEMGLPEQAADLLGLYV